MPAYLRRCAPWLSPDEVRLLQRPDPRAWTTSDLPLLDAARLRVGDPDASLRRQRAEAAAAAELEEKNRVVEHLVETDQSDLMIMSMLRGADLQAALVDDTALPAVEPDRLSGPFAHVVVDEAQELTDAEWRMLLTDAPPAASPSSATAPRPATASPSRGTSGSPASASTRSTSRPCR